MSFRDICVWRMHWCLRLHDKAMEYGSISLYDILVIKFHFFIFCHARVQAFSRGGDKNLVTFFLFSTFMGVGRVPEIYEDMFL